MKHTLSVIYENTAINILCHILSLCRGFPQRRTGEELTDDHDHYLVEQPALLGQGDLEEFPWAGGSAQSPEDRDGQLGMSVAGVNPSKLGGRGDTHQERSHKAGTTSQEM